MPKVIIDGIEYVPKVEILPASDERLAEAVKQLVAMLYFGESHKALAQAWDVLNVLSPDMAKLVGQDEQAAYDLTHPSVGA